MTGGLHRFVSRRLLDVQTRDLTSPHINHDDGHAHDHDIIGTTVGGSNGRSGKAASSSLLLHHYNNSPRTTKKIVANTSNATSATTTMNMNIPLLPLSSLTISHEDNGPFTAPTRVNDHSSTSNGHHLPNTARPTISSSSIPISMNISAAGGTSSLESLSWRMKDTPSSATLQAELSSLFHQYGMILFIVVISMCL
jgi:pectate lyase